MSQSLIHSRRRAHALLLGTSVVAIMLGAAVVAQAQQAQAVPTLDTITAVATKTDEKAIDSLSAVSTVRQDALTQMAPGKVSNAFMGVPGVWFQERPDDPASSIAIRGLQDFGRVAVVIDGARQNFQRTGHAADGVFYLEPELIADIDVVRGPVANIYGSGAIGGVVSFRTKDVDDVLRPGQQWGILTKGEIGSNSSQLMGSAFAAVRVNPNAEFMFGGTTRSKGNYKDGNGTEILNTGSDVWTGVVKGTFRPADGHEVKLGYTTYDASFVNGQPFVGTTAPFTGIQLSSIFPTEVRNQIATARWTYGKPEDRLFNFDGNVYWTQTATDQTKAAGLPPGLPPAGFGGIGNIGDKRNFTIDTVGFDIHNTSRFDTGAFTHALTYGADGFRDDVDTSGFGVVFTPGGQRSVSGAFVQLKSNYSSWLEVITAARYDRYSLDGVNVGTDGDRVSPKITVGITPVAGITPYVTYAEGYRAPSVTETLIAGIHPVAFAPFEFLANSALRPEVGKNKEIGLNLKFDNVFQSGDGFRGKFNVFRNDVDDYIELVPLAFGAAGAGGASCITNVPGTTSDCQQYQNITKARLEGAEFETTYDAGVWFAGLAGSHVRGENSITGAPLAKVMPDSITTTLGARLLDRKLTLAVRWQAVAAKSVGDIPVVSNGGVLGPAFPPTENYNLVNAYLGYQATPDVLASLSVENLFNEQYGRYLSAFPNPTGSGVGIPFPEPGVTVKASLQVRFGEDFLKRGGIF